MRILQVSDLHFGAHEGLLERSLEGLTHDLKPDIILATGDLTDRPTKKNLKEALGFLQRLATHCSPPSADAPQLLVIPGNHDVNYLFGTAWPYRNAYHEHFREIKTKHYFETEKVWIYGFDSARHRASGAYRGPTTGAIGTIRREEIAEFQVEFRKLQTNYPKAFDSAFKIVALHHHPLPVKQSAKLQRWLLLDNAGTFLAVALQRKIDLIVHGHEHEQARAMFGSTLGESLSPIHVVSVVSAGSCLAKGQKTHYVNLIVIGEDRSATVEAYLAKNGSESFTRTPEPDPYSIRDPRQAREKQLQGAVQESGFVFHDVASTNILNEEGDCKHVVQCDTIEIQNPAIAGGEGGLKRIVLPSTTGDVDPRFFRVEARAGEQLAGIRLTEPSAAGGTLDFGRTLRQGESVSLEYEWWSLNAFAMDEGQFLKKYGHEKYIESAFFNVLHPIENLSVMVRFPDTFAKGQDFSVRDKLLARVKTLESDSRTHARSATALAQELRNSQALTYIDSLKVASLRVKNPVVGHAYGISWRVPPIPLAAAGVSYRAGAVQIRRILDQIDKRQKMPNKVWRRSLKALLVAVAQLFQKHLLLNWNGDLDLSLMVFNEERHKLEIVASMQIEADWTEAKLQETNLYTSGISLNYGSGVAGKAYKTNHNRLWVRSSHEERHSPDYYVPRSGSPDHAALLSMPVQNPRDERFVYAVMNCGSRSDKCPLVSIGNSEIDKATMKLVQTSLNLDCLEMLEDAVGKQEHGHDEYGPGQ